MTPVSEPPKGRHREASEKRPGGSQEAIGSVGELKDDSISASIRRTNVFVTRTTEGRHINILSVVGDLKSGGRTASILQHFFLLLMNIDMPEDT